MEGRDKPLGSDVRHVLSVDQFDAPLLGRLFDRADFLGQSVRDARRHHTIGNLLGSDVLYRLFYEPSTRTYESFGFAAAHMGMKVLGTQSVEFSSVSKGETLEDTIQTINAYLPSVIVLRHPEEGAAARAARVSQVPVINAGDGRGEHPTQTLLDLYTVHRHFGRLDGLNIVIGGDLANGRTTNSLAKALGMYADVSLTGISRPELRMSPHVRARIEAAGVRYTETSELFPALAEADVVYWTRTQSERLQEGQRGAEPYVLDVPQVRRMKPGSILMHPLPRTTEITRGVDADPRAVYLTRQMQNGMFVRMALIEWVLRYTD